MSLKTPDKVLACSGREKLPKVQREGRRANQGNLHQLFAVDRSTTHFLCCVLGHLSTDGSGTKTNGILIADAALRVPGACQGRAIGVLWGIQGVFFRFVLPWPAQEDQRAGFMCHALQSNNAGVRLSEGRVMHRAWLNSDPKCGYAAQKGCIPQFCSCSTDTVQFWQ